jgi:hypothetical protein
MGMARAAIPARSSTTPAIAACGRWKRREGRARTPLISLTADGWANPRKPAAVQTFRS